MPGALIFFVVLALLIGLSVRERMRLAGFTRGGKSWDVEPVNSPLARALANLVGVAGGIYLSLTVLVDFLEISVPARLTLGPVTVEPIAAIAIGLAIIQPFALRLFLCLRRDR